MKPVNEIDLLDITYISLIMTAWMADRPMYFNSHAQDHENACEAILERICITLETNTISTSQKTRFRYFDLCLKLVFSDVNWLSSTMRDRYLTVSRNKLS